MNVNQNQYRRELIGALLLERDLISQGDLDKALALQAQVGGRLGSIFVRIGALSEEALLPVLAQQLGLDLLATGQLPASGNEILAAITASGLSLDWFLGQELAIWEGKDGVIHAVSRNPIDHFLNESLAAAFPAHRIAWHFARSQDIEALLKLVQGNRMSEYSDEVSHLRELAEEAPVIELVNNVIALAADENASDIHIEPEENEFKVRLRVDGLLQTRFSLPRERFDAVASRIKLISGLDIAERRLPQDGRISLRASGMEMDIRVSVLPSAIGESIVMRLLPKERSNLHLDRLGMESDHLAEFHRYALEPHGIILVTGPTGSGKSTTLYAMLETVNDRSRKIITVEDPVEYKMPGITQIQTHSEIGYNFARALRSILRHDPDIIMIGEIRDIETAEIAVQSALTGHMVFSTLHTNDAVSAFSRLLDMGVEPFLVSSSVRAVEAQRLVRKLCRCCESYFPPAEIVQTMERLRRRFPQMLATEANWRAPKGCDACHGTGYQGRLGIYEFVPITAELQSAIMRRASANEMAEITRATGCRSMRDDGLIKAWRGLTSIDEVLRVTGLGEMEQ